MVEDYQRCDQSACPLAALWEWDNLQEVETGTVKRPPDPPDPQDPSSGSLDGASVVSNMRVLLPACATGALCRGSCATVW